MERKTVVKFSNPYDSRDTTICYTEITVKDLKYQNKDIQYYSVQYKHKFKSEPLYNTTENKIYDDNPPIIYPHPFANDNDDESIYELKDGNIIVKNDLTSQIVRFLLMSDKELSKNIGQSIPCDYRRTLIHDIAKKWD